MILPDCTTSSIITVLPIRVITPWNTKNLRALSPFAKYGDNHVTEHHTSERIQRFSYARLAHIRLK